jgi:hypothetical protein
MEKTTVVLLELQDDAAGLLFKAMAEENDRLRKENARLSSRPKRTPESVWTPQGRAAQSARKTAYWAERKAKAAATASAQGSDVMAVVPPNGHDTEAWV